MEVWKPKSEARDPASKVWVWESACGLWELKGHNGISAPTNSH